MSTIVAATTYPDGTVLDVANHNANVFSTTSNRGVMSVPNGGLEQPNLVAGFKATAEHVMSEEAVMSLTEGTTFPMDIYSNGFGIVEESDVNFFAVGGLCQRVYIPFDVSTLVWEYSFFLAAFRPFVFNNTTDTTSRIAVDFRVFIDGTEYTSMRRSAPVSADVTIGGVFSDNYERVGASYYDFAFAQTGVTKGYHELAVKLYMERPIDSTDNKSVKFFVNGSFFGPDQDDDVECVLHTRVTFGTRSVRAIMFK